MKQPEKYNGLGEPEHMNLSAILILVNQAFGETPYLVGSATHSRDFRDVDIRVIMEDKNFIKLFGDTGGAFRPFWVLVCASVSEWISQRTGLKVDFQVQQRSKVKPSDWDKMRDPMHIADHNPPYWR